MSADDKNFLMDADTETTCQELYNLLHGGPHRTPYMRDPQNFLILDCRQPALVSMRRIHSAYRVDLNLFDSVLTDLGQQNTASKGLETCWGCPLPASVYSTIIVYDDESDSLQTARPQIQTLVYHLHRNNQTHQSTRFIKGGFKAVYAAHPHLCPQDPLTIRQRLQWVPYASEIVPNEIYLGNYHQAQHEPMFHDLQLTHVLNISHAPNSFPHLSKYANLPINDEKTEDMYGIFETCHKFAEDCRALKGRLFIHCTQGISRSPTVLLAHLMRSKKWNLADSANMVRTHRPSIRPNTGFIQALLRLEKELFGVQSNPDEAFPV